MRSTNHFPTGRSASIKCSRTGALDAQLRAVLLDKKIDQVTAKEKPTEPVSKQQSNTEQMLQFIDLQIEQAGATHASQECIENLTDIRARLSAQLEQKRPIGLVRTAKLRRNRYAAISPATSH